MRDGNPAKCKVLYSHSEYLPWGFLPHSHQSDWLFAWTEGLFHFQHQPFACISTWDLFPKFFLLLRKQYCLRNLFFSFKNLISFHFAQPMCSALQIGLMDLTHHFTNSWVFICEDYLAFCRSLDELSPLYSCRF